MEADCRPQKYKKNDMDKTTAIKFLHILKFDLPCGPE